METILKRIRQFFCRHEIKVFEFEEIDYVAARSKEEAIKFYMNLTGVKPDEIYELTEDDLNHCKISEVDDNEILTGEKTKFRAAIDRMIVSRHKFPEFLCTSEF